MKKFFTLLSVALLSVSAFAELAYNATLTQNDFNNNKTVISKIVPDGSEVIWEDGQIRCGGSDKGAFSGPAWNWDDKGVVIALAAGVPNQLSFQYATNNGASTKGSTNWTASDWYVDESADGSSWTNAWTTNSNSTSFSSKTVSLKTTTRYIRMYFSGNFAGYFKDIKVTEQILMGAPSPAVLDFGTVKVDDAVEAQTFTINYTGMVPTASSSDTHFTVTPESFGSLYDYKKNQTITVGLKTNEAGEYNGTITVSGRGKSAQVTISGKVEKYNQSINWEPAETYNYGEAIPVATATSGLEVSYEISDESVLKFENGAFVTLHGGEVTVTAKQAGNYKYNAAEDVTKTITIVPPTTYGNFKQTICDEAVTYNYVTYPESFTGDVTVGENYLGGDSIVHVNIVINHASFGTDEMEMTYGEEKSWHGVAFNEYAVGTYELKDTLENAVGCDSIVTLTLTVNKQETLNMPVDLTFCAGDSAEFRGKWYFSAEDSEEISAEGATRDTLYVVNVIVLEPSFGTDELEMTYGEEKSWHGVAFNEYAVGTYELKDTLENAVGCDSIVTLILTVNKQETLNMPVDLTFCAGDSAEFRGKWYFSAEDSEEISAEGATRDTLYVINVTVLQPSFGVEELTMYVGEEIEWNGIALKDSAVGAHTVIYETTNVVGCDSTVTLTLTVQERPTTYGEYEAKFCEGDSVEFAGKWYFEATQEDVTLEEKNVFGGDSIVALTVKMLPVYAVEEMDTIVQDSIYEWQGEILTTSELGTFEYTKEYTTVEGCDSIITLYLTVVEPEIIEPEDPTGLEQIEAMQKAVKEFRNGVLYIRREGKEFTLDGRLVK